MEKHPTTVRVESPRGDKRVNVSRSSYSNEFKASMVRKIFMPDGPTVMELSRELGIHHTSLRQWIKKYGNSNSMTATKKQFQCITDWSQISHVASMAAPTR